MKLYENHEAMKPFPCPACSEYLSSEALQCHYCNAEIDPDYASSAVRDEKLANRRYRKGHYSKHLRAGSGLFALGLFILIGSYIFFPLILHTDAVWIPRGLILGGGGDFLYGVWGLTSEQRDARKERL